MICNSKTDASGQLVCSSMHSVSEGQERGQRAKKKSSKGGYFGTASLLIHLDFFAQRCGRNLDDRLASLTQLFHPARSLHDSARLRGGNFFPREGQQSSDSASKIWRYIATCGCREVTQSYDIREYFWFFWLNSISGLYHNLIY